MSEKMKVRVMPEKIKVKIPGKEIINVPFEGGDIEQSIEKLEEKCKENTAKVNEFEDAIKEIGGFDVQNVTKRLEAIESDYLPKSEVPLVPSKVSQLENDEHYLTEVPDEYITENELVEKGYLTEVPEEYAKKTELPTKTSDIINDRNYQTIEDVKNTLSAYATKKEIPTKVSELQNDSNYLTEHQDLSAYAEKIAIPTKTSQLENDSDYKTGEDITTALIPYAKSDDVTAEITKEVAKIVAGAPEDFDTLKEMADWILNHENDAMAMNSAIQENKTAIGNLKTEKVDVNILKDYAKRVELPVKISELTNDKKYQTDVDLKEVLLPYAKTAELPTKLSELQNDESYQTSTDILNTLKPYAKKTDLPETVNESKNGLMTSAMLAKLKNISADGSQFSGNSTSASKLAAARKIGNASFDGSKDIALADIGGASANHNHDGAYHKINYAWHAGDGKTYWIKVCTLKIISNYVNYPIRMTFQERGRNTISELNIKFASKGTTDPDLESFKVFGAHNGFYIIKTATSTWDLYCNKYETYAAINVVDYVGCEGVNVTWSMAGVSDKPAGCIQAIYGGNVGYATNSGTVNNHTVESNVPANAKFTDIDKTKLPLAGGTLTGDVSIPTAKSNLDDSLPVSSGTMSLNILEDLAKYKTYLGAFRNSANEWHNIISVRHRNGFGDGSLYGMYLRSPLTTTGDLLWGKQYGQNLWQAQRTLIDSFNYGNYCATKDHTHSSLVSSFSGAKGSVSYDRYFNSFFPSEDGSINLGCTGQQSGIRRWSNIYAVNTAISTSDEREKDIIGTVDDKYKNLIKNIKPLIYKFRNKDEKDKHDRIHTGFSAQNVKSVMDESGLSDTDFAGYCCDYIYPTKEIIDETTGEIIEVPDKDKEPLDYTLALRYEDFIPILTAVVQDLIKENEEKDKKILELENRLCNLEDKMTNII